MARGYLAAVGIAYVILALWCALAPEITSESVGFSLRPGQGQSEYLAVYGGLQLALGLVFLWPIVRPETTRPALGACLLIFVGLVLFRSIGFVVYSDFEGITYALAGFEWLILLAGLAVWRLGGPAHAK